MITIRLLESKISLTRGINDMKNSLLNMKHHKTFITETFYNIINLDKNHSIDVDKTEFDKTNILKGV